MSIEHECITPGDAAVKRLLLSLSRACSGEGEVEIDYLAGGFGHVAVQGY
jgi:hypothetical protein